MKLLPYLSYMKKAANASKQYIYIQRSYVGMRVNYLWEGTQVVPSGIPIEELLH